jgi:hypothetical protein
MGDPPQAGRAGQRGLHPVRRGRAEAREILAAMEEAKARGAGATVYKGRLVDIASIKQAEVIVRMAEMIAGMTHYLDFEKPLAEIEGKAEELRAMARANEEMDVEDEAARSTRRPRSCCATSTS